MDPWVGKIPWSRKWQPAQEYLPRKSRGQRSLAGCRPQGCKELGTTERAALHPAVWHTFSLHSQNRPVRLTESLSLFQRQGNRVSERASHFLRPHNWPRVVSIKKKKKKWITGFHPSNSGLLLNSLCPLESRHLFGQTGDGPSPPSCLPCPPHNPVKSKQAKHR